MRVVVTRPLRDAQRWVFELQQRGFDAVELPLIEIGTAPDEDGIRAAWEQLDTFDALMFVSANAAAGFFRHNPAFERGWPHGVRAWAPGPGTADALLAAGVPRSSIDQPARDAVQFDSEALWAQVRHRLHAGQRVLMVRGGNVDGQGTGRDWLGAQLQARGVAVEQVVAYSRRAPTWTAVQRAQASACVGDGSVWLFSSSEAVSHLRSLLAAERWDRARAIATHPRIRQAALEAGFGVVHLSRPALADVVASIESMR
ncbi:MAG: uroporphyrinogen-III synthase [Ramlibacter sp.]